MTKRAAMYVRMSTEHQQYSIVNQADAIEKYAAEHKLTIVKKFIDAGKSGLTLAGRPALRQLLLEVLSGDVQFEHVLVYDVSRWGRFQDADESAYYEYTCKKANIRLHYCVEQFRNDGSPYSALLKAVKRTMAGEYSRELSVKVHAAQRRFAGMGFHQGGSAGYGLRRLLVDASGNAKRLLGLGQRKDLPTDRVLLVPGPAEEIAVVRKIFKWFTTESRSEEEIASILNQRRIKAERCQRWPEGPKWTKQRVHRILTSPRYIGTTVYNRTSNKLSEGTVFNPRDQWVCREGAVKPLVEPHVFQEAQNIVQHRSFRPDNYQILDQLSALLKRTGKISERIISKEKDLPCIAVILKHFKSLLVVYELIGYNPVRDCGEIASRRQNRISEQGLKSLGEGIRVAVASGRLPETFTLTELKAVCPGWSPQTYGPFSAHCVGRKEQDPLKLKRVGRGKYQLANPARLQHGYFHLQPACTPPVPRQASM
jgi:DNA invertase Pin-like site-specific DNA recombinase